MNISTYKFIIENITSKMNFFVSKSLIYKSSKSGYNKSKLIKERSISENRRYRTISQVIDGNQKIESNVSQPKVQKYVTDGETKGEYLFTSLDVSKGHRRFYKSDTQNKQKANAISYCSRYNKSSIDKAKIYSLSTKSMLYSIDKQYYQNSELHNQYVQNIHNEQNRKILHKKTSILSAWSACLLQISILSGRILIIGQIMGQEKGRAKLLLTLSQSQHILNRYSQDWDSLCERIKLQRHPNSLYSLRIAKIENYKQKDNLKQQMETKKRQSSDFIERNYYKLLKQKIEIKNEFETLKYTPQQINDIVNRLSMPKSTLKGGRIFYKKSIAQLQNKIEIKPISKYRKLCSYKIKNEKKMILNTYQHHQSMKQESQESADQSSDPNILINAQDKDDLIDDKDQQQDYNVEFENLDPADLHELREEDNENSSDSKEAEDEEEEQQQQEQEEGEGEEQEQEEEKRYSLDHKLSDQNLEKRIQIIENRLKQDKLIKQDQRKIDLSNEQLYEEDQIYNDEQFQESLNINQQKNTNILKRQESNSLEEYQNEFEQMDKNQSQNEYNQSFESQLRVEMSKVRQKQQKQLISKYFNNYYEQDLN